MSSPPPVRRVILGTAGHIDHGKTALVERLTGTRTDRLKEERERGMTIDVGYAAFVLPDGTEVGLLDVPGHERLVRTMVAAATAMDLALLVVAADDGPMPQTREHVDILDVLGVERLIVALTKTDLADEDVLLLAEEEIREMLEPTGMRGAPVLRVSSATGQGVEALKEAIAAALPPASVHATEDRVFRMPILRAFVAPGRGTVVTGIPLAGRLAEGAAAQVLPPGWPARVRAIQVHRRPAAEARVGQRTALALSDVASERIHRGMVVAEAGVLGPVRRVAVRLRLLSHAKPLKHRSRVRFHVGADQVVARLHLLEGRPVRPGATAVAELQAFDDVVCAPGDRFVLRAENASCTLGGGVVVEVLARPLPRRRKGLLASLEERVAHLDDPSALLAAHLAACGEAGTRRDEAASRTALRPGGLDAVMDRLVESGGAVRLGHDGQLWVDREAFERAMQRVEAGLERLHARDPALASHPISAVRTAAGRLGTAVLDAALARLIEAGRLVRESGGLRLASHRSALSDADRARMDRVAAALARGRGQPPSPDDLAADLALDHAQVERALRLLANRGRVFRAGEAYFDSGWIEEAKEALAAHARSHGGFTPADARTLLDSTRKWVIPLLEALDKAGFCRRQGDRRVLR